MLDTTRVRCEGMLVLVAMVVGQTGCGHASESEPARSYCGGPALTSDVPVYNCGAACEYPWAMHTCPEGCVDPVGSYNAALVGDRLVLMPTVTQDAGTCVSSWGNPFPSGDLQWGFFGLSNESWCIRVTWAADHWVSVEFSDRYGSPWTSDTNCLFVDHKGLDYNPWMLEMSVHATPNVGAPDGWIRSETTSYQPGGHCPLHCP